MKVRPYQTALIFLALLFSAIALDLIFENSIGRSVVSSIQPRLEEFWFEWREAPSAVQIFGSFLFSSMFIIGGLVLGSGALRKLESSTSLSEPPKVHSLQAASQELEKEIINVLALFRSQMESSEQHSEVLRLSNSKLEGSQNLEQIRAILKYLISENEQIRHKNRAYREKLEDSRKQIANLQVALTETQELTVRDSLTNAFSRRHFDSAILAEAKKATSEGSALSLIMTDLDGFKRINDSFGHPVGDEVLKSFAALMIECAPENACVARYGGEEFAVILPGAREKQALDLAEDIRRKLERKRWAVRSGALIGKITASFGVAQHQENETANQLIERTDGKLYEAKSAGRNRVFS